ncbi:unnamed protein product [Rotaria sordida]|uniref:VWFA domain-containing protein n=1 Tax=Rotaria sordida TaxID=392033 RepID=A0A814B5U2_9BILA|nr:unnamed protein product [Rotaria sordida]CAF0932088.1 unnamed protein product [Rotaria sordida]
MTTFKNGRTSVSASTNALLAIPYSHTNGETRNFDLTTSSQDTTVYTAADPPYISSQLKSSEWLQRYGLKAQKLTFDQILQQIGLKRIENFNASRGKTVDTKYAGNIYHEIQQDNGDRYVLTCRPEKLAEYRYRLIRMLNLLRKRLTFITSGSRRAFGIIGEPSVCFVCDCKTSDQRILNQFQTILISLFKEQVTKIKRFNIIWVSNDNEQFQQQPIDVTSTTIDQAIDWISNRKCLRSKISMSATCEAMLKAFNNAVHSIYLISEGTSSDSAREMLRDNIVKTRLSSKAPIPIHVVSLFCHNNDTETFLQSIAQTADGSYMSYKINNEIIDLKSSSNVNDPTRIKLQDNKLQFGTNPLIPKTEHPTDTSLIYKEIIQCQNIIDRLEKILGSVRDENVNPIQKIDTTKSLDSINTSNKINKNENNLQRSLVIQSSALFNNDEKDMASIDWLKIYGINAQKLDFFSVLQSAALQHCDGVVTSLKSTDSVNGKNNYTQAISKDKLINAKYCDQFAHVTWPDGTIRHVYVTPELYRDYERRMKALLEKVKARLQWLKKGSRDIFGTIIENNIYLLIDTSKSMQDHLTFLKEKLRLLIQDQLFSKERINIVSFNTTINPWRDRLTKINTSIINSQLQPWIDGLYAEGSTNTLAAIRYAFADPSTEAIYLLTDGRPDQNERHILSQVQYRQKLPIHTIAFNCQDSTANQFLFDLAKQTGGRFHAFNYGFENELSIEIPESEDISYLKQELAHGEKDLQRIADLRDECISRAWSHDNVQTTYPSLQVNELSVSLPFRNYQTLDMTLQSGSSTMSQRIDRKKRSSISSNRKRKTKSATRLFEQTNTNNLNYSQWLLPETEEYLRNSDRKRQYTSIIENEEQPQALLTESTKKLPTPFDEVNSYLKKNSLVSRHLTIFDVLHPISVPVKEPHHVQVIDRYVLAKVWDDILPLTYASNVNKLRLVNHYAVNLEQYEIKLKDLITDYYQFTSKFIWKCLNDEDKQRVGPHIYWISLSKEDQYKYAQEITKEEHKNEGALELFVWRKLNVEEQNNLLQKPPIYDEKTENLLKNALQNAEVESALQGVMRMDVEIKRAIKFLQISTDIRRHQKRTNTESKQKLEQKQIIKRKSSMNQSIGKRVICRYDGDGYFYTGTIQKNQDGRIVVLFDMDIEQEASGHTLLPLNNSNSQLILFLLDYVLVRQIKEMEEYWVPGVVSCLPSSYVLPSNLYMIQIYDPNPKQIYVHRKDIIRITLGLFQRSVLYLENINQIPVTHQCRIFKEPETSSRSSSLSQDDVKNLLHEFSDPLTEKLTHISKSHNKRFNQLQKILEDLMNAIRILRDQPPTKTQVKVEYAQTVQVPSPIPTPIPPTDRSDSSRSTSKRMSSTWPIEPETHVYAVWSDDDGLVYEGIVKKSNGSNNYIVERTDFPGVQSTISRNDIFLNSNLCQLKHMEAESFALIKYPKDSRQCYCPAVILRHLDYGTKTKVRFYDCYEEDLENDQYVIPIHEQQFERYTALRIEKEKSLINQVIVGLNEQNEQTKTFMLGTIKTREGTGHLYKIQWCNERTSEQIDEHLFGAFSRRYKHRIDDYVLAIDNNDAIYKLAKVQSISNDRKNLKVQFINLNKNNNSLSPKEADVPAMTTFVITEAYYNKIINIL